MNKFGILVYNSEKTTINGIHWSRNSINHIKFSFNSLKKNGNKGYKKRNRRIINYNLFGIDIYIKYKPGWKNE